MEGLFLSYYEMPGPHSGEKLNWLKGSSVEGRKEGRKEDRERKLLRSKPGSGSGQPQPQGRSLSDR